MNIKLVEQFKTVAYRICDERDCQKIAWKAEGKRQFCDSHYNKYLAEGRILLEPQEIKELLEAIDGKAK